MPVLMRLLFVVGIISYMNLLQANEKSEVTLSSFKWEHRLVIANVTDQSNFTNTVKTWPAEQLNDRKLKVFLLNNNQTFAVEPGAKLRQVKLSKSELDRIAVDSETLVLIGLDGGVKARFSITEFNPSTINGIIDSMPMRMAESFY